MKSKELHAHNVSILITTYQRNNFINLYLDFLNIFNFAGEVIIGNASKKKII